eukprot:115912_1
MASTVRLTSQVIISPSIILERRWIFSIIHLVINLIAWFIFHIGLLSRIACCITSHFYVVRDCVKLHRHCFIFSVWLVSVFRTFVVIWSFIPLHHRCFLTPRTRCIFILGLWRSIFIFYQLNDHCWCTYPCTRYFIEIILYILSLSCGISMPVVVEPVVSLGTRHFVSLSPTGYVIVFSVLFLLIFYIFFVFFLRVHSTVTLCRFCPVQRNCTTLYKIHSTWRWVKFKPFICITLLISYYVFILFLRLISLCLMLLSYLHYLCVSFDLFSCLYAMFCTSYVISCLVLIYSMVCTHYVILFNYILDVLLFLLIMEKKKKK